mmetsp:Transcript_22278/g.32551  ORF Transcript_22278/g.32551 Transcript_22278/m.32551 type:complete len:303 (+) Transcript_22278:723-1631(+)
MTGPNCPGPVPFLIVLALSNTLSNSFSCVEPLPIMINTDAAMQRWPAHPTEETITSRAVSSMSQSGRATRWFLAPPSATQRLLRLLHLEDTRDAMGDDPTNVTARTSGWSINASTASLPPCTKFTTPSGTPASCNNSTVLYIVKGTFSLGLSTMVFPMTSAMGRVHMGTIKGKLKGTILATTPSASRRSWHDTAEETRRVFPCANCGMEHAYSTVSFPLATSANASVMFLPFSCTMSSASSWEFSRTRLWNLRRMDARDLRVREDQDLEADWAEDTAALTSVEEEIATWAMVVESMGDWTGR